MPALLAAAGANAAEPSETYLSRISGKFGNGIINMATGVGEIPKGMYVESNTQGAAAGIPMGFFKGMFNMMGRTGMGAVEMLTFFIPTKPMVNPAFIWENFSRDTTYNTNWEMYNTK